MQASTMVHSGLGYLRRGLAISRCDPWLYVAITIVYATPALVTAGLVVAIETPAPWQNVVIFVLPWLTLVLGTVVIMVAVSAHAHGQRLSLGQATWRALPHVPRYVWTNAHTSIIFWVPVSLALTLRTWQSEHVPLEGVGAELAWWLLIAALALGLHTRTLLAPFLAIHGDLPGTRAAIEAWRLSHAAFWTCLSTLVAGVVPLGAPLAALMLVIMAALPSDARQALEPALPHLAYAGIQVIRPILVPATYVLYNDLWSVRSVTAR